MKYYLTKFWFFVGIALVIALAIISPGLGSFLKKYHILKAGIFAAFLITGLTLQTGMVLDELRNFKALSFSLISGLVLFPLIACLTSQKETKSSRYRVNPKATFNSNMPAGRQQASWCSAGRRC